MIDKEYFKELCARAAEDSETKKGIGTYSEKRLHRILKDTVADKSRQEVAVGNYVADVLEGGMITEVQTGSFQKYLPKLRYYLGKTDLKIRLVIPIISEKTLIRIDGETGEVIRKKRSPKRGTYFDGLASLYPIREILSSDRIETVFLLIRAEENRYSEKMRYRKEGAYISELFPLELVEQMELTGRNDYRCFLPKQTEFTAKEYSTFSRMKGRSLYSCLNILCELGILSRKKEGKAFVYTAVI